MAKIHLVFQFVYKICDNIIYFLGFGILSFLVLINIFFRSTVSLDSNEYTIVTHNSFISLLMIGFIILICYFLYKRINSVSIKTLFIGGTIIYLLSSLYLLFNVDSIIRADARIVYENAIAFSKGDFTQFQMNGYFYIYPHQLGLLSYNRLLISLSKNIYFHYLINALLMLLIQYVNYKNTVLLFTHSLNTQKLTILLSFVFCPNLFFILFLYGHIPSLACFISAYHFLLKRNRNIGKYNSIIFIIMTTLAYILRNNYLIGIIAFSITLILDALKKRKAQNIIIIVAVILSISASTRMIQYYYETHTNIDSSSGMPKLLWVAMGLQDDPNTTTLGGWYNAYSLNTYLATNCDSKESTIVAKTNILERIRYFKKNPYYAASFFWDKILSTWTDSTFQSIWSGPLLDCEQDVRTPLLKSIYNGGKAFKIIEFFGRIINILIYLGTALFYLSNKIINKTSIQPLEHLPIIFLLGGFLFHLVWETKSQYVWGYVYSLIPFAANGLVYYLDYFSNKTLLDL